MQSHLLKNDLKTGHNNEGEKPINLFTPKQLKGINLELSIITDLTWHNHQVPGKIQSVVFDTHSVKSFR